MRSVRPAPGPLVLTLAIAAGGALGAALRHLVGVAVPDGDGFPWTTLSINVVGTLLLALLPALAWVRHSRTRMLAVGPGLLGGFTTLSAYAEQGRALLADGHLALAAAYLAGTLAACLLAALVGAAWSTPAEQSAVAAAGGDE